MLLEYFIIALRRRQHQNKSLIRLTIVDVLSFSLCFDSSLSFSLSIIYTLFHSSRYLLLLLRQETSSLESFWPDYANLAKIVVGSHAKRQNR